jgi:glycosyltransferase involved in cell wall biosynthesis
MTEEQTTALKITVVIVTYTRAEMLKEALESLTTQSRLPDEVLVVDNNSSDQTKAVAESFNGRLNMNYVFEPVQGTSTARNTGIKHAQGDLIVYLDDDCIAERDWLHYMEIPFIMDPSIGMVGGQIADCRVKGTLIEDYCIASSLLNVKYIAKEEESR